jgi:Protein of unknown function (DUF4054)
MEITPDIVTAFRAFFKDFADLDKWPDDIVITALYESDTETGGRGWGAYQDIPQNFKRRGMFYFAAAWLSSNFGDGGAAGGISSEARLNVASKSIGDESIAYRVPGMMEVNNDWLTYTVYGQQFYRLRKRAGMGARIA